MTQLRVETPADGDEIAAGVLAVVTELRRMQTSGELRQAGDGRQAMRLLPGVIS